MSKFSFSRRRLLALLCCLWGAGASAQELAPPLPVPVPPSPAPALTPPPVPPPGISSAPPTLAQIRRLTPRVEVWRAGGTSPQTPDRHDDLTHALIAGSDPVVVRLQFHPVASGMAVLLRPSNGITIDPGGADSPVSPTGEYVVSVRLDEGDHRGHLIFHCGGLRTVLVLQRAPLAKVVAKEGASTGSVP
jgi:hypothetical protein